VWAVQWLKLFKPISRRPKAWMSYMPLRRVARSMPFWQTRGADSATRFWSETNITGTIYLVHKVGNDMRRRNSGKILITGSIAGFIPGSFQAVYNGTKAFLNSFSFALREELKDTEITVTCLMPGATETEFFRRAEMMDTAVGTAEKDDPTEVANNGFDAMMKGEGDVVSGLKNKVQSAAANVTPAGVLASQHRKMAEPGTAKK
jgi:short-subunit dehydrogenase